MTLFAIVMAGIMAVASAVFATAFVKFDALNRRIVQQRAADAFLAQYEQDDPDLAEWIRDHGGPDEYAPRIRWCAAVTSVAAALSSVSFLMAVFA